MIQIIGLMIGCYIITRMVELAGMPVGITTKLMALITLVVCVFGLWGLFMQGTTIPPLPR